MNPKSSSTWGELINSQVPTQTDQEKYEEKTQITNMRSEREDVTTDLKDIKDIRIYYEQLLLW